MHSARGYLEPSAVPRNTSAGPCRGYVLRRPRPPGRSRQPSTVSVSSTNAHPPDANRERTAVPMERFIAANHQPIGPTCGIKAG
jgi:hypothetical protein